MRVLILDDNEERHDGFRRMMPGRDLTHVYSYEEAVAALSGQEKFDLVCLDHDLSDLQAAGVADGEKTGYDVAVYIADMPEDKRPSRALIHTWNQEGAKRIGQVLAGKVSGKILPYRAPC